MNKAAADGGSSNNLKQTTMASNEEILKQSIPNFDNKGIYLPKFRVVFSRDFSDNVSQKILSSMDAARKDEVIEILKWLTSENSPYAVCYGSDTPFATIDDDYTIEQFYTIFKNRNS